VKSAEQLIASGRDLSASAAQALEMRLLREPDDLETRLLLIGFWGRVTEPVTRDWLDRFKSACVQRQRHLLWLVVHHPGLDLPDGFMGLPFASDPELAARWRQAAQARPDDDDVAWNAGKAELLHEPAAALGLFERAKRTAPNRAGEVLRLCSTLVGLSVRPDDPTRDELLGRCGLSNGLEAFELAKDDDARFMMVWAMRECARHVGDRYMLDLLRAADREGSLRRAHAADARDARHHACTGRGIVAVARGDLRAAEHWLREAIDVGELSHPASSALINALSNARR
jgi:hypothetical protein